MKNDFEIDQVAFDRGTGRRGNSHHKDNPYCAKTRAAKHRSYEMGFDAENARLNASMDDDAPMTQPVSPEDALKALVEQLRDGEWWQTVVRGSNPTGFSTDQTHVVRQAAEMLTRTPPPSALDEEVMRLEAACCRAEYEYPLLAAPDGTVAVQFADLRTLLTRLKDRKTD